MKTPVTFFALFALAGAARTLAADVEVHREFMPALLHSREDDHQSFGARFNYRVAGDLNVDTLNARYFAKTAGTVAWESEANPENIIVETGAGLRWLYHAGAPSTSTPINFGAPIDPNAKNVPVPQSRRPVSLQGDLKVAFETDQSFDNNQLTFGPRLGLTHTQNSGFWPLLPSVHIAYQRIKVLEDGFLQQNGISQRNFWRFDAAAAWKWRPFELTGAESAALKPIGLHLDARYFRSYDLPARARALDQQENFYTAGTVSYETAQWKYISSLYLTFAHGRLPPSTRSDSTLFAGVSIRH
jgi:hypothetical protein